MDIRRAVLLSLLLFTTGIFAAGTQARTIAERTGDCEITITMRIELWGDPTQLVDSTTARGEELEVRGAANQEVADAWKAQIESMWNGPTLEQARAVEKMLAEQEANANGEEFDGEQWDKDNANSPPSRANAEYWMGEFAKDTDSATGTMVNCCLIKFVADVRPRAGGPDDGTEGWHQIQAVRSHYIERSGLGLIPGVGDYLAESEVKWFRSWQYMPKSNDESVTGAWAHEPGRLAAAHEIGHVLGLKDQYRDVVDEHGHTHSEAFEGHEDDLMGNSQAFPTEAGIGEILAFFGVECNCCPEPDDQGLENALMLYGQTLSRAGTAIVACNHDQIAHNLQSLKDQLKNIARLRISYGDKLKMWWDMSDQITRLEVALRRCPKDRPVTGTYGDDWGTIGEEFDLLPGTQLEHDNPEYCTHRTDPPTVLVPGGTIVPGGTTPPTTGPPPTGPGSIVDDPPGDGGDDPRDAGGPCEEELEILRRFMENHGDQLKADASNDQLSISKQNQARHDLREITRRMEELESECGEGANPPGGTVPGEGEDPGDVTPPPLILGEEKEDPCARLKFLRMHSTHVWRQTQNPRATAEEKQQAEQQLKDIDEEVKQLEKICDKGGRVPKSPGGTVEEPTDILLPEDGDDPTDAGKPKIVVYMKMQSSVLDQAGPDSLKNYQFKLHAPSTTEVALPGNGVEKPQTDHDKDPIQGLTDEDGNLELEVPIDEIIVTGNRIGPNTDMGFELNVDTTTQGSSNVAVGDGGGSGVEDAVDAIPDAAKPYLSDTTVIGDEIHLTFTYPAHLENSLKYSLNYTYGEENVEVNSCGEKEADHDPISNPLYPGNGAWGQDYDNQWAIKRVGFTSDNSSAWRQVRDEASEVIVAVVDTGLDWNHMDFNWDNLWNNPGEIPDNGIDDDGNGYVDDVIGWNFYGRNNKPWDHDGHGTLVSGIIAADGANEIGITGINPNAKIMVLKALNGFGHTRASFVAKAIAYAVDNGAQVVNLSVGSKNLSRIEQSAIRYAAENNVLLVVAAGNSGIDVSGYGMAGAEEVLTVAATGLDDDRAPFSNYGEQIDVAAPGVEVLGLRARRTDTMRDIPGVVYEDGANYVGDDKRYYRASGTSFAAPIVAGTASLILSNDPSLSAVQVARMLRESADDLGVPGVDQVTGYGIINAAKALQADPDDYVLARLEGLEPVQVNGKFWVRVSGSTNASRFRKATISIGAGESPTEWKQVENLRKPASSSVLTEIDADEFRGSALWQIRLVTEDKSGATREYRLTLNLG